MNRIALTTGDVRRQTLRRKYVPIVTTIIASVLVLLPIIVSSPLVPDLAFLVLIAWRCCPSAARSTSRRRRRRG